MQGSLFGKSEIDSLCGSTTLEIYRHRIEQCQKCPLSKTRTNVVFGEGHTDRPPIAFVGEGPGVNEDQQGRPFVGLSGQLLDRMIIAMGLTREGVYLCNVVACRPPKNRNPLPEEMDACRPYFKGQLEAVRPEVIVALGATAAQALLRTNQGASALRGVWHRWMRIPIRVTYHPAYLFRNPKAKGLVWEDLKAVMERLSDRPIAGELDG